MDLGVIARVGVRGVGYTAVGIAVTLLLTLVLTILLRTDPTISLLVGVGTAICGGSAIAAVAPVIRAKSSQTSVALAVVFCLNAVALVVFPQIGHAAGLSPRLFGLWSAVAIHDTSSVVGAALTFGPQATEVATTVKLARTLWIIPLALAAGYLPIAHSSDDGRKAKPRWPWFIIGFVLVHLVFVAIAFTQLWLVRERGFDAGNKVKGRKRHLLVDTLGLILVAVVHSAAIQDREGAKLVIQKPRWFGWLRVIFADAAYSGQLVTWVHEFFGRQGTRLSIVSRLGHGFRLLAKRWIVERTFSWLTHSRRLAKDYEVTTEHSEAFIYAAAARLMLRRLAPSLPDAGGSQVGAGAQVGDGLQSSQLVPAFAAGRVSSGASM
jgi:uncharacterized integral membrane protein (TIGR00698 family)